MKKKSENSVKQGIPSADLVLAGFSGIVYLFLRLIFHKMIKAGGYQDGGLISYDSYYHYAFARELSRTGNHFFFQNPFGTLDGEPHLFNLYASFLKLVTPIHYNNIFVFDCTVGTLLVFVTSLCLLKVLSNLGVIEKLILLFGGGVAFIGVFFNLVSIKDAVLTGYWGLTYLLNQISTPEIVYHLIFFFGLLCLLQGKDLWVLVVVAVLTFLHPFTAMTFNVSVGSAWFYEWFKTRNIINRRIGVFIWTLGSVATSVFLFQIYLPLVSKDAQYFKMIYTYGKTNFSIDILSYILFLILPIVYCIGSIILRRKSNIDYGEKLWIFTGTTICCVAMCTSYLVSDNIAQPAHWSRVYPYVFFIGIGGSFTTRRNGTNIPKAWRLFKICLLCIAICDSAFGAKYISESLFFEKRPPLFLSFDQTQIIEHGRELPPGVFIYLRDESNKRLIGDFEYAMMSLSPQKGFFGHPLFSPHIKLVANDFYPCSQGWMASEKLLAVSDYIILDTGLVDKITLSEWDILYKGSELVFMKKMDGR